MNERDYFGHLDPPPNEFGLQGVGKEHDLVFLSQNPPRDDEPRSGTFMYELSFEDLERNFNAEGKPKTKQVVEKRRGLFHEDISFAELEANFDRTTGRRLDSHMDDYTDDDELEEEDFKKQRHKRKRRKKNKRRHKRHKRHRNRHKYRSDVSSDESVDWDSDSVHSDSDDSSEDEESRKARRRAKKRRRDKKRKKRRKSRNPVDEEFEELERERMRNQVKQDEIENGRRQDMYRRQVAAAQAQAQAQARAEQEKRREEHLRKSMYEQQEKIRRERALAAEAARQKEIMKLEEQRRLNQRTPLEESVWIQPCDLFKKVDLDGNGMSPWFKAVQPLWAEIRRRQRELFERKNGIITRKYITRTRKSKTIKTRKPKSKPTTSRPRGQIHHRKPRGGSSPQAQPLKTPPKHDNLPLKSPPQKKTADSRSLRSRRQILPNSDGAVSVKLGLRRREHIMQDSMGIQSYQPRNIPDHSKIAPPDSPPKQDLQKEVLVDDLSTIPFHVESNSSVDSHSASNYLQAHEQLNGVSSQSSHFMHQHQTVPNMNPNTMSSPRRRSKEVVDLTEQIDTASTMYQHSSTGAYQTNSSPVFQSSSAGVYENSSSAPMYENSSGSMYQTSADEPGGSNDDYGNVFQLPASLDEFFDTKHTKHMKLLQQLQQSQVASSQC